MSSVHFLQKGIHNRVSFETIADGYPPQTHDIFVAVKYTKINALRTVQVEATRALGYRPASYMSSKATIFFDFKAGENAFILEENTIQPFTRIGTNVILWSGNHIGHHSIIEDNCFITSHVVISGRTRIGANLFIGVNVTIRNGVTLGWRCVLGAGALILTDVPDESVLSPGGTERSKMPCSRLPRI